MQKNSSSMTSVYIPSPEIMKAMNYFFMLFLIAVSGDVWADTQRPAASVSQEGEERPAPHGSSQAEEGPLRSGPKLQKTSH